MLSNHREKSPNKPCDILSKDIKDLFFASIIKTQRYRAQMKGLNQFLPALVLFGLLNHKDVVARNLSNSPKLYPKFCLQFIKTREICFLFKIIWHKFLIF